MYAARHVLDASGNNVQEWSHEWIASPNDDNDNDNDEDEDENENGIREGKAGAEEGEKGEGEEEKRGKEKEQVPMCYGSWVNLKTGRREG